MISENEETLRSHAIRFVDHIVESADTLLKNPTSDASFPEFNRPEPREVILWNYRIVYREKDDGVFILRAVHGAQDLLALVRREPWDIGSQALQLREGSNLAPYALSCPCRRAEQLPVPQTAVPAVELLCEVMLDGKLFRSNLGSLDRLFLSRRQGGQS